MEGLTQRQAEVFEYIQNYIGQNAIPPTRVEIAKHFDFKSRNSVQNVLAALQKKHRIIVIPKTARGIQIKQQTLL